MFSVLYVDDETGLLDIGKIFLESLGNFSIDTAPSACIAISMMNEKKYDAIVSDYQMSEMDGIEFLRRVRASGSDIPFILFTGRGREEIAIQALNEGADFYLQKGGDPIPQFTELAHKIRQAVNRRSAELALKESEKRLSDIINFLPDATFAIDLEGKVIAWNRAMEELTHIPSADMLGRGDHEYAVPIYGERRKMLADLILEPDQAFMENYRAVQSEEGFLIAETALFQMGGRPVALMGKAGPLYDQRGQVVGAIESIRDITNRVRTEEELRAANERISTSEEKLREQYDELLRRERELRESKERLQMFMDSASDAFTIWDRDLKLVDINQNALAYLPPGTRKEDILGKSYAELLPTAYDRGEMDRCLEVMRTGVPFTGTEAMPEPGYGSYWYNVKVFKAGDGLGIVTHDITQLKKVEEDLQAANGQLLRDRDELRQHIERLRNSQEALRTSEERFRAFTENVSDLTTITDEDGRYIYVSPSFLRLTGLSEGEVLGRVSLGELSPLGIDTESGRDIVECFREIKKHPGRSAQVPIVQGRDREGRPIFIEGIMTYLPDVPGIRGVLFHGRDVTDRVLAERAVKESEERYRSVVENSPYGMHFYRLEPDGSLIFTGANPSADHILNVQHDRFIGKAIEELFPLLVGTGVPEKYRQIAREGGTWQAEQVKYEGESIRGAFSVIAFQTSPGNMAAMFVDITERKLTEEALIQREDQFRQLISLMPVPICLLRDDGTIQYVNRRFQQSFGYTIDDLRTLDDWWGRAYPDEEYRRRVNDKWVAAVREAKSSGADIEAAEFKVTCKDRTVKDVIISGMVFEQFTCATFIDITERKLTEDALQRSERKNRTIVDNLIDLVYEADMNGNFTMVSPSGARLLGFSSPAEMIGLPISRLCADPEDVNAFMKALSKTGSLSGYQLVLRSRDGTPHYFITNSRFAYDDNGALKGVEGVLHDVTELRRVENALRMANRKLTLLSGITRHDIKNQLVALNGHIYLGGSVPNVPERMKQLIEKMQRASDAISRQIDFTKDYEELGVRSAAWHDVNALARNAAAALPMRDIKLIIHGQGLEVFADPLVEKVFYNLMDNSLRHGGANVSTIKISMIDVGGDLKITYQDDGEGIRSSDKDKLFTRGYGKNTGLGLFLSREILSITGITICENGEPGKGARFEITVPSGVWRSVSGG